MIDDACARLFALQGLCYADRAGAESYTDP